MKIYVGNLSHDTTEDDLRRAFGAFGRVDAVTVITGKLSGESKKLGFVEMPSKSEAGDAIFEMDGEDLKGNTITVSVARSEINRGHRGLETNRGGGRHR